MQNFSHLDLDINVYSESIFVDDPFQAKQVGL